MEYQINKNANLKEYDFKLNKCKEYQRIVCVYHTRKEKTPLVFMKSIIDKEEDFFGYNIIDREGKLYSPFYDRNYGKNSTLDIIDVNIQREINKLVNFGILIPEESEK